MPYKFPSICNESTIVLGRVNTFIEEQLAKYLESDRNSEPYGPHTRASTLFSLCRERTTCFYGPINYVHKLN